MRRLLPAIALAAGVALMLPASAHAAGSRAPRSEPRYEPGPCDDVVPADPRVQCGTLTVPLDRAHPGRGDATLPVAIIRSADPDPLPDPIVYFSGGPGGTGRTAARSFLEQDLGRRRDVIVFDQRGTGKATPNLDCPAQIDAVWEVLGAAGTPEDEADTFRDVLRDCRRTLVDQGVDLDMFDTSTTTDDVADLRRALDIDEWNLFGVSYGTTVGLEMLRRHPEGVRAAVLDSVYPTTAATDATQQLDVARRALGALFRGCAKDAACAAAYPTLEADLDALVDEWDAQPFETTVTDPATGQPRTLAITGVDVVAGLWNAMYDETLIPLLPSLVAPLRARTDFARTVVEQLASGGIEQLAGAAEADFAGVDCADRQRLNGAPQDRVAAANPRFAGLLSLATTGNACDVIRVASVPAAFNRPVHSRRPVLLYGDEYDPVTPPGNGRAAARTLPRSTFVSTHGLGHGVARANECTRGIFDAFLDDPATAPDIGCAAEMSGPAWVIG